MALNQILLLTYLHLYVKFGDANCNSFWHHVEKQTHRQTNGNENPHLPLAWV